MTSDYVLTRTQLAKKIKVSYKSICRWEKDGLPHIRMGKRPRFNYDDVIKWFKKNDK